VLSAPERQRLRREIDRKLRERLHEIPSSADVWISMPEAAALAGIRIKHLRVLTRRHGIVTRKRHGAAQIQVAALDRLRELRD
jgi:hypothetical protein